MPQISSITQEDKSIIRKYIPKSTNKILAAGIAKLYIAYPDPNRWSYTGLCGAAVLCYDTTMKCCWLKLVDVVGNGGVLWDQELYENFEYFQDRTFFYSFEIDQCFAALSFSDESEGSKFYRKVIEKGCHPESVENSVLSFLTRKGSKRSSGTRQLSNSYTAPSYPTREKDAVEGNSSNLDLDPSLIDSLVKMGISKDQIEQNADFVMSYIHSNAPEASHTSSPPSVPSVPSSLPPSVPNVNGPSLSTPSIPNHVPNGATSTPSSHLPPPPPPPESAPSSQIRSPLTAKKSSVPPPPPPKSNSSAIAANKKRAPPPPPSRRNKVKSPLSSAGSTATSSSPFPPPPPPPKNATSPTGRTSTQAPPPPPPRSATARHTPPSQSQAPAIPARSVPSLPPPEQAPTFDTAPSPALPATSPPPLPSGANTPSAPPPPPPAPAPVLAVPAPAPPPAPVPPAPSVSGDSSDSALPVQNGRADLMASIRASGGIDLLKSRKSTSPSVSSTRTSNPPQEAPSSNNLMDALASALNHRKTKVAQSDEEDQDDDEWD